MDSVSLIVSAGAYMYNMATTAKSNRYLCENLASMVQAIGMIIDKIYDVRTGLAEQDEEELERFIPDLLNNVMKAKQLVNRASSMGVLKECITSIHIQGEFRDIYATINGHLASEHPRFTRMHICAYFIQGFYCMLCPVPPDMLKWLFTMAVPLF